MKIIEELSKKIKLTETEKEMFEQKQERNPLPLSEAQGGVQLHDKDHVHVLFRGQPNSEISKFINAYKSASSRLIKKEYPEIKKHLLFLQMLKNIQLDL